LQLLDFSRMDLAEFYAEISDAARCRRHVLRAQQKINSCFGR
jgi:hypothetical protein